MIFILRPRIVIFQSKTIQKGTKILPMDVRATGGKSSLSRVERGKALRTADHLRAVDLIIRNKPK